MEPKVARFQSFFTPVCLRFPRRTGVCLILDPKALNAFVRVQKLQSILFAVAFLHKEEFLVSIDIKDACASEGYQRFAIGEAHYQFVVLPFGLASAPQV